MKKILFILMWQLVAGSAYSQQATLDSLLKKLPNSKEDTLKAWLLIKIADILLYTEPINARTYIQQAASLSQKLNFNTGIIRSNATYADSYQIEGKIDSALIYIEKNLDLARTLKDSLQIGIALLNMGVIYRDKMEFEKALAYSLEGKAIFEKRSDPSLLSQVNDALQTLYNYRTEYDKAIIYGEQAVAQARQQKDPMLLIKPLVNLSLSYIAKLDIKKGAQLLEEALAICKPLNNPGIEAVITQNLGDIALKNYDIPLTKKYITYSLSVFQQTGSMDGQASCLRALAVCHLQEKNYTLAKTLADSALVIDKKYGFKREEAAILRVLSCIYYATNDVKKGFHYDDQSNIILEAMVKDVISQQSANLEKKYETTKKENEIRQLKNEKQIQQLTIQKKNLFNYVLMGGAFLLLIVLFLVYRNYNQKRVLQEQRISELETEKKLLATEAVLKGEEQERTRLAKDLHDGLGGMLSGIKFSLNTMKGNLVMTPDNAQAFERSMDMLDSSIKEMRRVAHNMMPEALVKFGLDTALKDFCYDINQMGATHINYQALGLENKQIDQTVAITVYRIIQELINNTLKHAAAKNIIVQVSYSPGHFNITVEDDGKGFDISTIDNTKGMGWTNIQHRVEFLKGHIDLKSTPEHGTSYFIEFPLP